MAQYTIYGTNKPYRGKVVKVGNKLYTTKGGTLEAFSKLLVENSDGTPSSTEKLKSTTETTLDKVTTFRVGDGSKFGKRNRTYYYANGSIVPTNTPLHHHTIAPEGRSNFMTSHAMDEETVDIFIRRPSDKRKTTKTRSNIRRNNLSRTTNRGSGPTTRGTTTGGGTPRSGGGTGGGGGSGGGGGGY
tara:strand:+ start:373 stop:933 length:561 start_codon:yes stop_codon:yes gene_type:complete